MEYQEVILKDPSYTDWCITTMVESGGPQGTANWRLKRYATWAMEFRKNPKALVQLQNVSKGNHSSSSGKGSTSSFSLVTSMKDPVNIEHEEEMFSESESENRIQALEDQIRDLRRQGKKGKTSNQPEEHQ
eukprot:s182_g13.t1